MKTEGLAEFLTLVSDFKRIQALFFKGMIAIPLAGIWLQLGPPTTHFTPALLTLTGLLVLVLTFQVWYPLPAQKLRTRFVVSTSVCLVALVGLVCFLNFYTVEFEGKRVVIGTQLQDAVARVLEPGDTALDTLKDSNYHPSQVWTPDSVRTVETLLDLNWLVAVMTYTAALAAFAMLQRKRPAGKKATQT
jgi:hypothetical protein